MGRLIDADKLKNIFLKSRSKIFDYRVVIQEIDYAPTVEAIPKADYEARLNADMDAILAEIQLEIEELEKPHCHNASHADGCVSKWRVEGVIQKKINELKGEDLPHCQYTDKDISKSFIEDVEAVEDQLPCGFKDKKEIYTNGDLFKELYKPYRCMEEDDIVDGLPYVIVYYDYFHYIKFRRSWWNAKVCKDCDWYNRIWMSKDQYEARLNADIVNMLTELKAEFDEGKIDEKHLQHLHYYDLENAESYNNGIDNCIDTIQVRIDKLKGEDKGDDVKNGGK